MLTLFAIAFAVQIGYWLLFRVGLARAASMSSLMAPPMASPIAPPMASPIASPIHRPPDTRPGAAEGSPAAPVSAPPVDPDTAPTRSSHLLPPISVIVAARNEEAALPVLLRALSRQSHPRCEIIVVDDGSTDRTRAILDAASNLTNLVALHTAGLGKKAALARGINAASHELLAFTDADCVPPSTWLSTLSTAHASDDDPTVLIGYSPFRASVSLVLRGAGSLVQRLSRYETFITGVLTTAAAGLGRPYMAVGRNISYPRSVFDRAGGFDPIMHSLSGDDDLFVQEVVHVGAASVRAVLDPRSFVPTAAPATWRAWLRQKRRHTSAGRYYRPNIQAHLALLHGSSLLVWIAPLFIGWMGALLLAVRAGAQFLVMREGARLLHESDLLPAQPLLEPLYMIYNAVVAPIGMLKIPSRW